MGATRSDPGADVVGRDAARKVYDAFISYARHGGDREVATALQRGLQHLAKPWNHRRAMEVFRDETSLPVSAGLLPSIEKALDASRWLILVASPESAGSRWVGEELTYWMSSKSADHLLVVISDGTWAWDDGSHDLSPAATAVNPAVRGAFAAEPNYLDMRWARGNAELTLRNPRFRDQVATLVAAIQDKPKDEIESEDIRQQHRTQRIVRAVIATLTVLVLIVSGLGIYSNYERLAAIHQRDVAVSAELISQSELTGDTDPVLARLLSVAAWRISPSNEARYAMLSAAALPGIAVLAGSAGPVTSVAFSHDGKTLASADSGGTIVLWDMATRQRSGSIRASTVSPVTSVALSPDGKILASGSGSLVGDATVQLWDTATRRPLGGPLAAGGGGVHSVAFSPDGRTLAVASGDGAVRLWDVTTHHLVGGPLRGGVNSSLGPVAFSPDGRTLAAGSLLGAGVVWLWDMATGRPAVRPLTGGTGGFRSVAFSPDGRTLAAGAGDGTVRLWDVATGRPAARPLSVGGSGGLTSQGVTSVAFSPDGTTLASVANGLAGSGTVRLWDVATWQQIGNALTSPAGSVDSVAFSPDGRTLASGNGDGTVRLWDVATSRQQIGGPLTGAVGPVTSVAFSPDGKTVASAGSDGTVRLWNTATHQEIGSPLPGPAGLASGDAVRIPGTGGPVNAVAFSHDGKTLASAGATVLLRNPLTGRDTGTLSTGPAGVVTSLAFSPDDKILATANGDGTVRLWDVATRQQIGDPLTGSAEVLESVAFSPDGTILASAGDDGTIQLWDVATRRPLGKALAASAEGVDSVAFSPDGTILASGDGDGAVRLWNAATRKPAGSLSGFAGRVDSVAFSPDGTILASASEDGTIRLWDVATRQQIGDPLSGPGTAVRSVAFSPDGMILASASEDGTVRLWDIAYSRQSATDLCASAGRPLTRAEWTLYIPPGPGYQNVCP